MENNCVVGFLLLYFYKLHVTCLTLRIFVLCLRRR